MIPLRLNHIAPYNNQYEPISLMD